MTTTNPLIARLAEILNQKTEAALGQLADLGEAIAETITEHEEAARARIHQAQVGLDIDTADRLKSFEFMLASLSAGAVVKAASTLLERVEAFAGTVAASTAPEPVEASPEPLPTYEEILAEGDGWREYEEEVDAEPAPIPEPTQDTSSAGEPVAMPTPATALLTGEEPVAVAVPVESAPMPVAAHAVLADPVGVIAPEDDDEEEDDLGDDTDHDDDNDGYPVTSDPEGLHERRGQGRGCRYTPAEFPAPLGVYYRKEGSRWQPVRFVKE
jgi:hypothetical protein